MHTYNTNPQKQENHYETQNKGLNNRKLKDTKKAKLSQNLLEIENKIKHSHEQERAEKEKRKHKTTSSLLINLIRKLPQFSTKQAPRSS